MIDVPPREVWKEHDDFFHNHFMSIANTWRDLGWTPSKWAVDFADWVRHTLGWLDVKVVFLPVWHILTLPDFNMAATCVASMVPCGCIYTKTSFFPAPDRAFHKSEALQKQYKIGLIGDMIRCKTAIPTGVDPKYQEMVHWAAEHTFKQLKMWELFLEVTQNNTVHWHTHTYGYLIPPSPMWMNWAQVEKEAWR